VTEREAMAQALALAALGEGATRPNPMVGAIVLRDGEVAGAGFHRAAGAPHAEAVALAQAGDAARGGTLVVNLEPCAHHGRTPPCVDAIRAAGIGRVVVATGDPNPLVNGRGNRALRDAGIEVEVGLLEDEARRLNGPFLSWHERRRPFVTLKAAMSCDGQIAAADGSSTWVSGEPARRHAHRMRLTHDAVLVGAQTVRRDDPRLTARLAGREVARRVVVLSDRLDLPLSAKIFANRPRLYTSREPAGPLTEVADVVRVPSGPLGLDLHAVLADLAATGVQSVLVEGGGRTHAAFLAAGLADEVALFVAPRLYGARGATPLLDGPTVASPEGGWALSRRSAIAVGRDVLVTARPER
jgi:diaminohydroxyphosphoribosylaminopyrimidine deaminase/5-amino-6-(5-phosphoribosylamino)uracil reductase